MSRGGGRVENGKGGRRMGKEGGEWERTEENGRGGKYCIHRQCAYYEYL